MTPDKLHFIVIDDSKLDCFIAEKIIRNTGRTGEVKSFIQAAEALEFIKNAGIPQDGAKTIILVDIQMPIMNGFEFVEAFERFPKDIIDNYIIYVLSSSINDNDLNRARYHVSVKDFLNKPLTSHILSTVIDAAVGA
jgi:CheY-like chemotaxis protein